MSPKLIFYLMVTNHLSQTESDELNEELLKAGLIHPSKIRSIIENRISLANLIKSPKTEDDARYFNAVMYEMKGSLRKHTVTKNLVFKNPEIFSLKRVQQIPDKVLDLLR